MSFDVARHKHAPLEIYGEKGSLIVPDPNYFGGKIEFAHRERGLAGNADAARLCRRQLSHPRRRRHGAARSASTARIAPAARSPFMCSR